MEITEEHLREAFNSLELFSVKNGISEDEYSGILFAAGCMEMQLRAVLKAKSGEDLKLADEVAKECIRVLEETGDLLSFKYKCGHTIEPIILNTTVDSLATYTDWKNSKSGLCLMCWLEQRRKWSNNLEPKYVRKVVTMAIEVPTCPKCGQLLEEEIDNDARMMYHLKCSCGYRY